MAEPVNVSHLIRQTRRYEFSDGLRDLQLAVLFGLIGISSWLIFQPGLLNLLLRVRESAGRLAMGVVTILVLLLPAALIWFSQALMRILRRRWLWRESGMVEPARQMVPRGIMVSAVAIAVVVIGGAAALRVRGLLDDLMVWRAIWAASGWATAVILIGLRQHLKLGRYGIVGFLGGLISTGVLLTPLSFAQAGLWFGLLWGILWLVSGSITLIRRVGDHDLRNHRHQSV